MKAVTYFHDHETAAGVSGHLIVLAVFVGVPFFWYFRNLISTNSSTRQLATGLHRSAAVRGQRFSDRPARQLANDRCRGLTLRSQVELADRHIERLLRDVLLLVDRSDRDLHAPAERDHVLSRQLDPPLRHRRTVPVVTAGSCAVGQKKTGSLRLAARESIPACSAEETWS